MKILLVNKYLYRKAGAEKYFFDLSDLLRAQGHEVVMWGMEEKPVVSSQYSVDSKKNESGNTNPNTLNATRWNVSYFDFEHPRTLKEKWRGFCRMLYSREAKKKFAQLAEEFKPDVVHIHNIYHQLSPSFLDVCRKKKIPVVMSVHDYSLICPNYKLFANGVIDEGCKGNYFHDMFNGSVKGSLLGGFADAFAMFVHHKILNMYEKSISYYLCPSEFVQNKLIEFGMPKEKVVLLRYFLNENEVISTNYQLQTTNYILAYGRLSEEKGFEVLIRAMQKVSDDVMLKIAGTGPDEERLKKITNELQLEPRVEFLGWQSGDEFTKLRTHARCVVVPSVWHDPSPFSILENLSEGTPVLGARVGGITETLEKIDPELLYDTTDRCALAKKIKKVLDYSTAQKCDYGGRAQKMISELYNPQDHYKKLFKLYNTLFHF